MLYQRLPMRHSARSFGVVLSVAGGAGGMVGGEFRSRFLWSFV
jgi:hypothetical protein